MPRISVLLPVYNGGKYVGEAIESILAQTYPDFELIVTDDCSTDDSPDVIRKMAAADSRIRVFTNPDNRGVARSLNQMIDIARGEYLARMDADDLAIPTRFEQQTEFLDSGMADVCGTWIKSIGRIRDRIVRFPVSDAAIKVSLLFQSAFMHPSVMMRAALFADGFRYRLDTPHAEDYDLWVRLTGRARMANIPQALHRYRHHSGQVSSAHAVAQWETASDIRLQYLDMLGIEASEREREVHCRIRYPVAIEDKDLFREMEQWLGYLADRFSSNPDGLTVIAEQWFRVCVRSAHFGPYTWLAFRRSGLRRLIAGRRARSLDLLLISLVRLRYQSRAFKFLETLSISG